MDFYLRYMDHISNVDLRRLFEIITKSTDLRPLLSQLNGEPHNKNLDREVLPRNVEENTNMVGRLSQSSPHCEDVSNGVVDTPTYNQIFRVPKKVDQEDKKFYGRELLAKYFPTQYAVLRSNHHCVSNWLKSALNEVDISHDLRHRQHEQQKLRDVIKAKIQKIKPLHFSGASYTWKEEDIYSWALVSLQSYQLQDNGDVNTSHVASKDSTHENLVNNIDMDRNHASCSEFTNEDERAYMQEVEDGTQFPCGSFLRLLEGNPSNTDEIFVLPQDTVEKSMEKALHENNHASDIEQSNKHVQKEAMFSI